MQKSMDFKTISVPTHQVVILSSDGELVETPMSLHLSLPSSGDDEHIFIFGGKTTLYKAFPVKKDITPPFPCITSCDYHNKWMTPRESFSEKVSRMKNPRSLEQQQQQQQCSHCLEESSVMLQEDDGKVDKPETTTVTKEEEEEPLDLELAQDVEHLLCIEEKVIHKPENISLDLESNCSTSDGLSTDTKRSKKARVYQHRKWKWTLPNVVPIDNIITSRNEFKLVFYCLHMKDPKRVYTIPEIRKILSKLGYTGDDNYGPLNSARSHFKHFRMADLYKPRGCRTFLEMIKNEKKVKVFSELADKLLLDLN